MVGYPPVRRLGGVNWLVHHDRTGPDNPGKVAQLDRRGHIVSHPRHYQRPVGDSLDRHLDRPATFSRSECVELARVAVRGDNRDSSTNHTIDNPTARDEVDTAVCTQ